MFPKRLCDFNKMASTHKTTIKDIADAAGVSVALVSFVMNNMSGGKYRVSAETTQKILSIAKELDYQPNNAARSLRKGCSNTIGVILSDVSNPFFAEIARCIEDKAYQYKYTVIFGSTDEDAEKLDNLIKVFINKGVDGLIIVPCDGSRKHIERVLESNIPLVLLDRTIPDLQVNSVLLDNKRAAMLAVDNLVEHGCRKIEMISYAMDVSNIAEREAGYLHAMKQHEILDRTHINRLKYKNIPDQMEKAIKESIDRGVEALVFATNTLAVAGLKIFGKYGLRVSDNIAVVCFDSSEAFELFYTTISYVQQPIEQFGQEALDLLIKTIKQNGQTNCTSVVLRPELVEGCSSMRQTRD